MVDAASHPRCYPQPLTTAPDQLARDRTRLAELEARWSPSIMDLTYDDSMRWYRTGEDIRKLRRRIEAAERGESERISDRIEFEVVSRGEPS